MCAAARPDILDEDLAALRADMQASGGASTPIWFTEFGDATVPGAVPDRQQAEGVARVVGIAAPHGVTRMYWYDAIDDAPDRSDPEDDFGLFRAATSLAPGTLMPKPSAAVVATTARETADGGAATSDGVDGGVRAVTFHGTDGVSCLLWRSSGTTTDRIGGGGEVVTTTGRVISRLTSVTLSSSPVWLPRGARLR